MRSSAIAGHMPSSMSSHRSSPPLESHVRTGSVSSTGSSSSARPAADGQLRGRGGGQLGHLGVDGGEAEVERPAGPEARRVELLDGLLVGDRRARAATCGLAASGPATTSRWRAASATVVVSTPLTAVCEPLGADVRDAAVAGLEPDQAGEAGRDAGRPAAVARGRDRHEAGGHRGRRPAARAAGRAGEVPRVAGDAPRLRLGEVERAELGGRRLADRHRAGGPQAGHVHRVLRRPAAGP